MLLLLVAICLKPKISCFRTSVSSWVSWNCPARLQCTSIFLHIQTSICFLFHLYQQLLCFTSESILLKWAGAIEQFILYRNASSVVWNIFWCLSGLKAHIVSMSIIKKKLNAWFDVDFSGAFSKRHCIEMLGEWLSLSTKPFLFCFSTIVCGPLSHARGSSHLPCRGAAELPIHKHPQRRHLVFHSSSNAL